MKYASVVGHKIFSSADLQKQVRRWKLLQKKIVFTNGCFDILHKGHLEILSQAASFGDILVVGVNADSSVKKLKGEERPINDESFRSAMLASMLIIDGVTIFEEETPLELIKEIEPDVLVKGGDYTVSQIIGAEEVIKNGGEIKVVPFVKGYSTTSIIQKIQTL